MKKDTELLLVNEIANTKPDSEAFKILTNLYERKDHYPDSQANRVLGFAMGIRALSKDKEYTNIWKEQNNGILSQL